MIDNLQKKYEEFKNVVDILPVNTKANRKKKSDYILQGKNESDNLLSNIKKEINYRTSKFNNLQENTEIHKLEEELEKCNIINEWNIYNTSYEKMHLDYYLYQLHKYYKEDLTSVNSCIKKIIESFNKVGINITKEDFDFNKYVSIYMEKILNNDSEENLKICFEEMYWKFPEIIKTIEINIKNIYLKNEKKINKYYDDRHQEFLQKHKDSEIIDMRLNINEQINKYKSADNYLVFQRFKNGLYNLADYNVNDISKKRELYFEQGNYNYDNLKKLYQTLFEYNLLLKYNSLLIDMRDRLGKKDNLKNSKINALKEINKDEIKLKKLNAKQYKKPLLPFMKPKNDEKWLFDYKNVLNDVIKKYDEFDNACFNDLVFNKLSQDSTVFEVLRLISSNYLYFVSKMKELDDSKSISDISDEFDMLRDEINNNKFTLINNIALLDEKQMKEIIVNKYNLENINLTVDLLEKDNIQKTINDIEILLNYENIKRSGINLEDVKLYLDAVKMGIE